MALLITFLSDYGSDDEFAGVCRAVIAGVAPEARVIDLTHGIRRHDVRQGAAVLANALPYAPPGVHLAVVDPGVGGERRAVAVSAAAEDRILVGPDNGLLWPALERFGGPVEAVEVSRSPLRLEPVSATFHGRDVFAPVAAALASGAGLAEVGDALDPGSVARLERPEPRSAAGRIEATVGLVDRFGNVALEAGDREAGAAGLEPGGGVAVEAGGSTHRAAYARTFADAEAGSLLVYLDSYGALALAVNQGSAAERLGLGAGDVVTLRLAGRSSADPQPPVPEPR